MGMQRMR